MQLTMGLSEYRSMSGHPFLEGERDEKFTATAVRVRASDPYVRQSITNVSSTVDAFWHHESAGSS
jgi:hypothetical protein